MIHRDIKFQNILFRDVNDLHSLVLVDFGFTMLINTSFNNLSIKKCGTPGFVAPEILNLKVIYF